MPISSVFVKIIIKYLCLWLSHQLLCSVHLNCLTLYWPVLSLAFLLWLTPDYFLDNGRPPGHQSVNRLSQLTLYWPVLPSFSVFTLANVRLFYSPMGDLLITKELIDLN